MFGVLADMDVCMVYAKEVARTATKRALDETLTTISSSVVTHARIMWKHRNEKRNWGKKNETSSYTYMCVEWIFVYWEHVRLNNFFRFWIEIVLLNYSNKIFVLTFWFGLNFVCRYWKLDICVCVCVLAFISYIFLQQLAPHIYFGYIYVV